MNRYQYVAYIASPLGGNIEKNMERAKDFCKFTKDCGIIPYAPHLLFTDFMDDNLKNDRTTAMEMSNEMIHRCDELWVFTENGISNGMALEIAEAHKCEKNIRFWNVPDGADKNNYKPDMAFQGTELPCLMPDAVLQSRPNIIHKP